MVKINSAVTVSLLFIGAPVQHALLDDSIIKGEIDRTGDTAHRLNSYRAK